MNKLGPITAVTLWITLVSQAQQPVLATKPKSPSASDASVYSQSQGIKASSPSSKLSLPPEKSEPQRVPRFEQPPVIDGKLDDEIWKSAVVLKDFYQVNPGDNIAPSKPTEVLLGYDSEFFYIAFQAYDEPGHVRVTVPKRDDIFDDDYVGCHIDTYNDKRKAYILNFNPLGVQADGLLTVSQGEDYTPDFVMESKGVLTDNGYTVEVAIPFKSLRYRGGSEQLWGVNFFRRIKRFNDEEDSWMPRSRDKSGILNQLGQITGFEDIPEVRRIEIIPSLTISETGKRVRSFPVTNLFKSLGELDSGRFVNQPLDFDPGVNVKFGITPSVTLDLTVNPDFAQVEADQVVITANQRFPIFFPEKRPFFLEGIDIFQTPLQALHTRAIIDPDVAAKLSGKAGRNSFGILVASDNAPGNFSEEERDDPFIRPTIERLLDKNAYIGIVRLRRDVGKENSIGTFFSTYNFVDRHNHNGGVDGNFRLNEQTTFEFQVLGTTLRALQLDSSDVNVNTTNNGLGYFYRLAKEGRRLKFDTSGEGRTRNYVADVGFTPRTNTNAHSINLRYISEPDPNPKARIVSWRIVNFFNTNYDWQRRLQYWNNETQFGFNFQRQTYFRIGSSFGYERIFEEEFGPKRTDTQQGAFFGDDPERSAYLKNIFAYGETIPIKQFSAFVFFGYKRGQLDFDFGAGPKFPRVSPAALNYPNSPLDPGPGNQIELTVNLSYQPTSALQATLDFTKTKLVRQDTRRVAFNDNIVSGRISYQFTRFTFARARVDYDSLSTKVLGQLLFGWTPNPGTAVYVGYNDDLNYNGFSPFTGLYEPRFRRNNRMFFIKLSYLFRRNL
jgi:hypothetical protein